MRILVFSQKLSIGGAVVTALDLATQLQRDGHDVHIFAEPGPLVSAAADRGLPYHEAPDTGTTKRRWPSPRTSAALRRTCAELQPDVVHSYEWPACLDAMLGPYSRDGVPLVASVMAMQVPRFMPRHVPLVVGTRVLHDELRRRGFGPVGLVEPPVDVHADRPDLPTTFRADLDIPSGAVLLAIVSRLDPLKAESAHLAIAAVEELSRCADVRLVIVGQGRSQPDLALHAEEVNQRLGRPAVLLPGLLTDPKEAYAAADVVLGMGGSALRGLAFGKPLVVLGTRGFAERFTPETSGEFMVQGFWGLGDGRPPLERLTGALREVVADAELRKELGRFGRGWVTERFALDQAADRLAGLLAAAADRPPSPSRRRTDVVATMGRLCAVRAQDLGRRTARRAGIGAPDGEG